MLCPVCEQEMTTDWTFFNRTNNPDDLIYELAWVCVCTHVEPLFEENYD